MMLSNYILTINKFYKEFFEKLYKIDIVLFWLFLGSAVAYLLVGFTNSTFTILGMIFLIGTFFSYGLIQNKRRPRLYDILQRVQW